MSMIKVRALREHGNRFGEKYRKAEGDEYDVPESDAVSLAAQGLVASIDDETQPAEAPKRRRRK
jgi:hypothetical protein